MQPIWPHPRLKNRHLVAIALGISALLLLSIALVGVPLSREFKGGSMIVVRGLESVPSASEVESAVEGWLGTDADVNSIENGFDIETDALDEDAGNLIKTNLSKKFDIPKNSITVEDLRPTLTGIQSDQARNAIIGALVAMGVAILIAFRRRFTVGAILLVIGLDMLGVLGCMALFRIPLSSASIVGIVMLIGCAINTNVLLTSRVLKRVGGEAKEHVAGAMRTGLMMNGATLIILLCLGILTSAHQLHDLALVFALGILVNFINTWFLDAGLLLWHVERQPRKVYHVGA